MTIKTMIIKFDRKNEDEIVKKKPIKTVNSNQKNMNKNKKNKKIESGEIKKEFQFYKLLKIKKKSKE